MYYKGSFMNIKMLKAAVAGLILSISGFANAGLITTSYGSNNSGSTGGAIYFDLTTNLNNLSITGFDINTSGVSSFNDFQVWLLTGTTSQGNEDSLSWIQVATGSGTGAGLNNATTVTLSNSFFLSSNTLYGFSLVADSSFGHNYTNGSGSNQNYSNTDLSLALGSATNVPFTGQVYSPRVWNGSISYDVPEPSTLAIFALGIMGLAARRFKKQ